MNSPNSEFRIQNSIPMDAGDGRRFGLANPSRSALNLRYVRKCFLAASDLARICLSVKATDTLLGKE